MQNALKINDFKKSALFCKYLPNESSDLYEILNLSSYISNAHLQNFLWRSVHTHARTRRKCARARRNTRVHVYAQCARIYAWIFMKKILVILYYLMSLSVKFQKDPKFRCRDIYKTILTFKNHRFSIHFSLFHRFAPPKSSKMDNFWVIMEFFGN